MSTGTLTLPCSALTSILAAFRCCFFLLQLYSVTCQQQSCFVLFTHKSHNQLSISPRKLCFELPSNTPFLSDIYPVLFSNRFPSTQNTHTNTHGHTPVHEFVKYSNIRNSFHQMAYQFGFCFW